MSTRRQNPSSAASGSNGAGANSENASKKRALNGIQNSFEKTESSDFLCPVCFEVIIEAHITKCGHTFCFNCISKSIEATKKCPKCNYIISTVESIFPNFLLNELITKHKYKEEQTQKLFSRNSIASSVNASSTIPDVGDTQTTTEESTDQLKTFLATESNKLTLPDVNVMLEILTQRKVLLENESVASQNRLLHEFLKYLLRKTETQQQQLEKKINLIKGDIRIVEGILKGVQSNCPTMAELDSMDKKKTMEGCDNKMVQAIRDEMKQLISTIDSAMPEAGTSSNTDQPQEVIEEGFNVYEMPPDESAASTYQLRKQRMFAHFDDFVKCYFNNRSEDLHFQEMPPLGEAQLEKHKIADEFATQTTTGTTSKSLDVFRDNLIKFSKYNQMRSLSTLNYSNDTNCLSTIVSSIEFDKNNEYFAIAGVTKRIKIFDYYTAIRDAVVDIKYPINEMVCNSKISCVIWNCYFKELLASSDYEGIVTIWDVETRTRKKTFQEHDKRSWSVDFNEVDTKLLASGSDDARVKLWSLDCEHSVATLEAKANVCCVKFNPKSSCHLAFGSADHCVHYYDLRNMKEPLCVFKGHKKAVSYVKFLNTHEIVSAGTDGQLKLWDINQPPYCERSFVGGHINEKNFVGLATNGDYLACGSEDNSLCVYYKGLSKQLFNVKFDLTQQQKNYVGSSSGGLFDLENKASSVAVDNNDFVSAVCWRRNSNIIIAGNSRGIIKILELV